MLKDATFNGDFVKSFFFCNISVIISSIKFKLINYNNGSNQT
jgi:hypothetical protein